MIVVLAAALSIFRSLILCILLTSGNEWKEVLICLMSDALRVRVIHSSAPTLETCQQTVIKVKFSER